MRKSFWFLLVITFFISCTTTQPQYKPLPPQSTSPDTTKPVENKNKEKIKQLETKIEELENKIKELEMKREKENLSSKEKDILLKQLTMLSIEQRKNMEYLRKITAEISNIKKEKTRKSHKNKFKKNTIIIPTKKVKPKKQKTKKISEDTLYITCYKMYLKKKYKESEMCFNKFIAKYPKSHLTSNAYFWIGETYFARANFPKAIDYYDIILTKFPQSRKVPSALLKEGLAFYELNDNEGAKIFLEKIIHDYPKTKQAEYAKKYLEKYKLNK